MRKRTGSVQKRGNSFRIRYRDADGTRHEETIGPDRAEAQRQLAIRLGEIAKGAPVSSKPNTVLFGELCDDVVTDYEVRGLSSGSDIEGRYRLHIIPYLGKKKAAQITFAMLNKYIQHRQSETPAPQPGTINREMEAIQRAFMLALEGRKILAAPAIPKVKEHNVRTGFFTRAEIDKMCAMLEYPAREMVLLGFLTGWRYGEIAQLEWRNVDFAAGELRIDVGRDKNREGRVFPFTAELAELMIGLKEKRDGISPFVFARKRKGGRPGRKTDPNATPRNSIDIRVEWLHACHGAGLPCVVDAEGRPLKALRIFHDLRRSAAREMERQGVRKSVIKMLMGHKTDSMFNRYRIVDPEDLREAASTIDAARGTLRPVRAFGAIIGDKGSDGLP